MLRLAILSLLFINAHAVTHISAWNGHIPSKQNDESEFTPYYVPEGSTSIDDSDKIVLYTPISSWTKTRHPALIEQTMHVASAADARVEFQFTGTSIEWFGSKTPKHGIADVFINGTQRASKDLYASTWLKKQRLFGIEFLPYGTHTFSIVNTGKKRRSSKGIFIDVDAFVINSRISLQRSQRLVNQRADDQWALTQKGETGVNAMQLSIISETHAIIIDKVEHNPLTTANGHPAWGALYDLRTNVATPLNIQSNSFCAGGSFLSNGSFINVGGNPVVELRTGPADFGDLNGIQAIRLFHPELCDDRGNGCDILEAPNRIRLASPRWYNTVLRLDDGSAMIIGGSKRGGWINNNTFNNPSIEFYPPKSIHGFNGLPIPFPFLRDTLNANLFPIAILLPNKRIFIAANQDAMIYDWHTNEEWRLPMIPNGVRVTYPMTGTATLLPLTSKDGYKPIILICGGSTIDDSRAGYDISSQESASDQCVSIDLGDNSDQQWTVENMPQPRIMPDSILLPTGELMIVNGAKSGIAGYSNVQDQVGYSNADGPVFSPIIYNPIAPIGERFRQLDVRSTIPRLYHSVATLVPDGRIMIAGSNPNLDRSDQDYRTEYRVEWLYLEWMENDDRPKMDFDLGERSLNYDSEFDMTIDIEDVSQIKVALMDLGFVTHSLHMNGRLVYLDYEPFVEAASMRFRNSPRIGSSQTHIRVRSPPHEGIYPPGPGFLYIVSGSKWSKGKKVLVGNGLNPPEDSAATENMLASTKLEPN